MKLKESLIGGLLTVSLLLTGCSNIGTETAVIPKPDESILNSFSTAIAAQNNDFGFQLYKEIYSSDNNSMISPVSVAMALAMTYNGAQEETQSAMAEVLKIQGIEIETLNRNNRALLYLLSTADPKVSLTVANSLWMREGIEFAPKFISAVQDFYLATAEKLDFSDSKAADIMNDWVKENTQGLIQQIVEPPIDPLTSMFLMNAVYFKGEWTHQFKKDLTTDQPFITQDNQSVTVPMMYQTGLFDYLKGEKFQALRLPYGEEEQMAMYLILPDEESNLEEFQVQLTQENWDSWLGLYEKKQGSIMLPRFTIENEKTLNQVLKDMGMSIAFEPVKANFSAMTAEGSSAELYISEIKHKTFIKVDEAGTEAAAVTSVEMGVTSMPVYDFNMEFNRPFFYAVHDRETGVILFMGSVLDPGK